MLKQIFNETDFVSSDGLAASPGAAAHIANVKVDEILNAIVFWRRWKLRGLHEMPPEIKRAYNEHAMVLRVSFDAKDLDEIL